MSTRGGRPGNPAYEHFRRLFIHDVNAAIAGAFEGGATEVVVNEGHNRTMFEAVGWQAITVKYGRRLRALFEQPGGASLRQRIDTMPNEEYQSLLRSSPSDLRTRLSGSDRDRPDIERVLSGLDDYELHAAIRDLGGHDLSDLLDAFERADAARDRPTVVFAYTIKAWRLPTEGHPGNHSALLSHGQWEDLAGELGADPDNPWSDFPVDSPEAELCRESAERLRRMELVCGEPPPVPADLGGEVAGLISTQQQFGRLLADVARSAPAVAERIVTVSPDVASSTNLGGWINRVGVWNTGERIDWFADDPSTLLRWRETAHGRHIELGIAESNLAGLLAELGSTWSRDGQPLLPIGTLYDPFVTRALEQWSFGMYSGGQSILVATPSGITLSPEGGAHQSVITPSIGLEQPRCIGWEPAFAKDLEWTLLHALGRLARADGESSYFRLTTRPIDQALARVPQEAAEREQRRLQALAGGYLLRAAVGSPAITLVGMGAVVREVLAAADELAAVGLEPDVVCLTSADLIFRAFQTRRGLGNASDVILNVLFPPARRAPIVTVLDGHPHTLAFLGAVSGVPTTCLGVDDFGQSGDVGDLYRHFRIDSVTIVGAALDLIEGDSL